MQDVSIFLFKYIHDFIDHPLEILVWIYNSTVKNSYFAFLTVNESVWNFNFSRCEFWLESESRTEKKLRLKATIWWLKNVQTHAPTVFKQLQGAGSVQLKVTVYGDTIDKAENKISKSGRFIIFKVKCVQKFLYIFSTSFCDIPHFLQLMRQFGYVCSFNNSELCKIFNDSYIFKFQIDLVIQHKFVNDGAK